ncbi:MAG: hypothetical protein LBM75_08500 [Myxococcales bacterium]|jgi:hypothetical protein|nr:hypothetical protein [Myxococcales bacterium]
MIPRSYILLSAILAALTGLSCAAAPAPETQGELPPELILEGVTYRYYEGSTQTVSGKAARATYRNETGEIGADELFALLHDEAKGSVEARGSHVLGSLLLRWADAEGGVEMLDVNGTKATTESASFDARRRRFFGETPVDVFGEGFDATATSGFSLNLRTARVLHFQGPILTRVFEH